MLLEGGIGALAVLAAAALEDGDEETLVQVTDTLCGLCAHRDLHKRFAD